MKKGFTVLITFSDGQIGAVMKHIDALQVKRGRAFIFCCVVTLGKLADIAIRYYSGQLVDNGTGREKFMAVLPGITAIFCCSILARMSETVLKPHTRGLYFPDWRIRSFMPDRSRLTKEISANSARVFPLMSMAFYSLSKERCRFLFLISFRLLSVSSCL